MVTGHVQSLPHTLLEFMSDFGAGNPKLIEDILDVLLDEKVYPPPPPPASAHPFRPATPFHAATPSFPIWVRWTDRRRPMAGDRNCRVRECA